jgi:hypothetical protein
MSVGEVSSRIKDADDSAEVMRLDQEPNTDPERKYVPLGKLLISRSVLSVLDAGIDASGVKL